MVVGDILSRERVWRLLNHFGEFTGKILALCYSAITVFYHLSSCQRNIFSRISGTTQFTWEEWSWTTNAFHRASRAHERKRQRFSLARDFSLDQIRRKCWPGKRHFSYHLFTTDKGGSRWSKAHVGTISISVMKKVRSMLDHAHFFFDEEGSNLHDIIEHDAEKIFPCDDTKASLFQNQFNLRHLKVF